MDDIHEIVLTVFGDLPKSCGECVFSSYGERFCRFTHREKPNVSFKGNGCAYAKVLPDSHGDLIDEDEFRQVIYREIRNHKKDEPITMILKRILWEMDNAPVIVEATE